MRPHLLLRRALWRLRFQHLSPKRPLWLPKLKNQLKLAFLAGSKVCLVPASRLLLRQCVLLLTNAKDARKAVLMVAEIELMVNALKAKANAVMAVATKVVQKAAMHVVDVEVNALGSELQSVALSAVTKHVLKVVQKAVAHVQVVAARAKKPVQMRAS